MGGPRSRTRAILFATLAVLAAAVVAVVLIVREDNEGGIDTGGSVTGCKQVEAPPPKEVRFGKPTQVVEEGEKLHAVVKTSCGTFRILLDASRAPKTVNSFAFLARKGFYDDLTFHRIVPGFVIQGGDPEGTGIGGPGYHVDEKPPSNLAYTKGLVAMAKSPAEPPGRSGSQFFVVLNADAGLPPEYALVGQVDRNFEVVQRIGRAGTPTEQPKQTVLIEEVTLERE